MTLAHQTTLTPSARNLGTSVSGPSDATPHLMNGDRLSRDEFERRYHGMPPGVRAELIEGVVYMSSPVRFGKHGMPHVMLDWWIASYLVATPGLLAGDNATVRLDQDNEPQPDLCLCISAAAGGQSKVGDEDYLEGAPELVAEVAASSVSIDLHAKLNAYRRNGVREYVVWRTEDRAIDWMILRGGQFVPLVPNADGTLYSEAFPGLRLDQAALIRGDFARVQEVLQQGLASPEHRDFVAKLASSPSKTS